MRRVSRPGQDAAGARGGQRSHPPDLGADVGVWLTSERARAGGVFFFALTQLTLRPNRSQASGKPGKLSKLFLQPCFWSGECGHSSGLRSEIARQLFFSPFFETHGKGRKGSSGLGVHFGIVCLGSRASLSNRINPFRFLLAPRRLAGRLLGGRGGL